MTDQIPVVVAGALGRMGAEVIKAVHGAEDCQLVGAIDTCPGARVKTLAWPWVWVSWKSL